MGVFQIRLLAFIIDMKQTGIKQSEWLTYRLLPKSPFERRRANSLPHLEVRRKDASLVPSFQKYADGLTSPLSNLRRRERSPPF